MLELPESLCEEVEDSDTGDDATSVEGLEPVEV